MTSPLIRVTPSGDLPEGGSATFVFQNAYGLRRDGFVVRIGGVVRAYLNCCPHQHLSLDYGDGEFFTPEGDLLLCRNHGALFEPDTGLCVAGPCYGASLRALPVCETDGWVCFDPAACPSQPDLE